MNGHPYALGIFTDGTFVSRASGKYGSRTCFVLRKVPSSFSKFGTPADPKTYLFVIQQTTLAGISASAQFHGNPDLMIYYFDDDQ